MACCQGLPFVLAACSKATLPPGVVCFDQPWREFFGKKGEKRGGNYVKVTQRNEISSTFVSFEVLFLKRDDDGR